MHYISAFSKLSAVSGLNFDFGGMVETLGDIITIDDYS
jgi:hypothetical protein